MCKVTCQHLIKKTLSDLVCFRSYASTPTSSLTRKSSWERPSSIYSTTSTLDQNYSKPSYSTSTETGYGANSKFGSTSSWRSSLANSDSGSSKYSSSSLQDMFPRGKRSVLVIRSVMGASNLVIHFYGLKHMPMGN